MNEKLKNLISRVKEQVEIFIEIIQIKIWQKRHGEEFREKYKNSKLVNPDVIKIYRDGPVKELDQPEHLWTEEEIQEVMRSLQQQTEAIKRKDTLRNK